MLECACDEPGGTVWRSIKPLDRRDLGRFAEMLEKLQSVPNMLQGRAHFLLQTDCTAFEVDDVGLLAMLPFRPHAATVHITFWDRRLRGRERLCRTMCEHAQEFGWRELYVVLRQDANMLRAFARRVGFVDSFSVGGDVWMLFSPGRD